MYVKCHSGQLQCSSKIVNVGHYNITHINTYDDTLDIRASQKFLILDTVKWMHINTYSVSTITIFVNIPEIDPDKNINESLDLHRTVEL